ncbi:MAG TPA: permease-like cell division protein FtsX [Candidatus Sulfotelmatobacter sp.]|jgi:cell division transport system permease protein|nr:permease-like cell division protein FtsX [Candidatus Sulfotelmatobacter sp.]
MRAAKTTLKHIRRSPYQSAAAVFIMMLTFLSITAFAFIVFGSSAVINFFESKPQVTAFFKDTVSQQNIDSLRSQINQTGMIASTKYVSKDQALQIYKEQNKKDPLLLDLVTADILPASLEISTVKIEDLGPVSQLLQKSPYVSEVVYQKDIVSTLARWTNAIRIVGISLIVILTVVSIFIMMTVIGFKVSQKRDEIEIMRLLSATNWYIRWPFMLEGIFYGTIGTIIGWIIATGGLLYFSPYLQTFLQGIPVFPISPLFLVGLLVGELVLAVFLGILASSLAVLRYLK